MPYHLYKKYRNGGITPHRNVFTRGAKAHTAFVKACEEYPKQVEWVSLVHVVTGFRKRLEHVGDAPEEFLGAKRRHADG